MFFNGDSKDNVKVIFSSWSGGKDSALAFFKAKEFFGRVDYIFTMFDENCLRTRAHGLKPEVIRMQADSIGVKLIHGCASWKGYEEVFSHILEEYFAGGVGVFGDIDLQEHLDWIVRVCNNKNVSVFEPLWKREREDIFYEFLQLGFKARVISVKKGFEELMGKELNEDFIELARKVGADLCGENGEFHTLVYDGPIFSYPLPIDEIYQMHIEESNISRSAL